MGRHLQVAWGTLAGLLLSVLPAAGQVQAGDLSMNLNGNISAGYQATYGNLIDSSHNLSFGGNGALSGFYYDPNFLSFNLSPYYDQSRTNSNFQSISAATGFDFSSGIFSGSHFPGSVTFAKSYNSQGNIAVPGVADFTTHGNSTTLGLNWSELVPDLPSLSFGYQQGSNEYDVYGANDTGSSHHHSFNLRSGYLLEGFNLSAYYSKGASQALIPQVVGNTAQPETTNSDSTAYGFAVSHTLPLRGQFSTSFNRSDINSDYLGYTYNGTIDTINTSVGVQPTNKLHLAVSANYTDNLNGVLYQSIVPTTGAVLPPNEQASHATDLLASGSYNFLPNLQTQVYADRRTQHFLGQDYGATGYGAGVSYSRDLFGGSISTSLFLIDNTLDHSDQNSLGLNTSVSYNRRLGNWSFGGSFNYAQNVQTLLVTYTTSYYNYSANVRRRFTRQLVWSASAGFSQTGLTGQPHTGNGSQSFSTGLGYGRWVSVNGSYSRANGHGLVSGAGITPIPLPPVIPDNLLILYGGRSYSFSVSSTPIRHLTLSAGFSQANSNTFNAGLGSWNSVEQFNALTQYQFRKMYFTGGYARLVQGFSASGTPPSEVSSFFVGVSRWFNFF
jgi:hypothetical protein